MSLVQTTDVRNHMSGANFTPGQITDLQHVIDGVERRLERYLHRTLTPKLVQEMTKADEDGILSPSYEPSQLIGVWDQLGYQVFASPQPTPIVPALSADEYSQYAAQGADGQIDLLGNTFVQDYTLSPVGIERGTAWSTSSLGVPFIPGLYYAVKYLTRPVADHGAIDDIMLKVLDVVGRYMTRNHDDSVSIKGGLVNDNSSANYTLAPLGWTPDELKQFDGVRWRMVV